VNPYRAWGGEEFFLDKVLLEGATGDQDLDIPFQTKMVIWNSDGRKSSGPIYDLECKLLYRK
jgi:hypothetical protein